MNFLALAPKKYHSARTHIMSCTTYNKKQSMYATIASSEKILNFSTVAHRTKERIVPIHLQKPNSRACSKASALMRHATTILLRMLYSKRKSETAANVIMRCAVAVVKQCAFVSQLVRHFQRSFFITQKTC